MKIDIIVSAGEIQESMVEGRMAIVIDVLRATTVMITALQNGANCIIPLLSPEEAFALKDKLGDMALLGGERGALPIAGFDFDNSPFSYKRELVENKSVVMTTSNGTRAINGARSAKEVIIASFGNVPTVVRYCRSASEIVIICSGSGDAFTLEDCLCAGLLASELSKYKDAHLSDVAISLKELYSRLKNEVFEVASLGNHFNLLKNKGYVEDLRYCFEIGTCNVLPILDGEKIINRSSLLGDDLPPIGQTTWDEWSLNYQI